MGLCKGNLGNLMQHWVLSEVLDASKRLLRTDAYLLFITSHSMAPWSVPCPVPDPINNYSRPKLDCVRTNLGRNPTSIYEKTWAKLSGHLGIPYPSSAVFTRELWTGPLSLILCENDSGRGKDIDAWLTLPEVSGTLRSKVLHPRDWRTRFDQGFVGFTDAEIVYAEMDPNRFKYSDATPPPCDPALYVKDLDVILKAFCNDAAPVVLQISSYDARGSQHGLTESTISAALKHGGFDCVGKVEADGHMISLVYTRKLTLWQSSDDLGQRFDQWHDRIERRSF